MIGAAEVEQLGHLFTAGPRGVYAGDTLSHQAIARLRAEYLAERREADGRNIITEAGVTFLFGSE